MFVIRATTTSYAWLFRSLMPMQWVGVNLRKVALNESHGTGRSALNAQASEP